MLQKLFGWIMEEKFQSKSPTKYFTDTASENIETCYNYFISLQKENDTFRKIYVPKEPDFGEKVLFVLSAIDVHFGSGLFKKVADPSMNTDELAKTTKSPLPSVQISGMLVSTSLL